MNSRRLRSRMGSSPASSWRPYPIARRLSRRFGRNLYPQKHDQDDQDRIHHDPHDVGSPTPSLLHSLLAHGEFSLGSQCKVPSPHSACHRTDGQVLGTNLNCSESRAAPRCETCLTARKSRWRPKPSHRALARPRRRKSCPRPPLRPSRVGPSAYAHDCSSRCSCHRRLALG